MRLQYEKTQAQGCVAQDDHSPTRPPCTRLYAPAMSAVALPSLSSAPSLLAAL